ncbi:MAG: hypothetical protein WC140_04070 [Bacteroidales bacterium]
MKKHYLLFILLTIFSVVGCSKKGETQENIDPNTPDYPQNYKGYSDIKHKDFTFRVNNDILLQYDADYSINNLKKQIDTIYTLIKDSYIQKICKHPIWVEINTRPGGGGWYHISKQWLVDNGRNPDKAKCVEIANYRNFIAWHEQNQPFELFHELIHLYHDQVLGLDYPPIIDAYNHAKNNKMYRDVSYHLKDDIYITKDVAYAMTNHHEYLTETSEAFFGGNDYFPFNKAQLKDYDPQMFQVLEDIWVK